MSTLAVLLLVVVLGWIVWKISSGASGGKRTLRNVEVEPVDGETLRMEGVEGAIRLARIAAPEEGEPGAERATRAVDEALEAADHVSIESSKQDRYGQHMAEVELNGENLSDLLLARGLVRPAAGKFVFPAETAKAYSDEPEKRYTFSIQFLPLPAAFRHGAIGLREEIRQRKRDDRPFEELLEKLYRLACVQNLMMSGHSPGKWNEPLEPAVWDSLEFPYEAIGFERLDLLGKRDQNRMQKAWGEPAAHRSVRSGAPEVADRFAERYQQSQS